jgi:hypothetical protein
MIILMKSCRDLLIAVHALGLLVGCSEVEEVARSESKSQSLTVAEVAAGYLEFNKITKKPVFVEFTFALDCAAPTREMVERVRKVHGPHTQSTIQIYMNGSAATAFEAGNRSYPVGAAIVKHKSFLGARGSEELATVAEAGAGGMIKRNPGFDPENGDWEYFYFEDAGKIASGKIQTCIKCHRGAKATDFVFGSWHNPTTE